MEEIRENGFNLNIPCYVDISEEVPEVDLKAFTEDMRKTDAEIGEVSSKLKESFAELGLEFPF